MFQAVNIEQELSLWLDVATAFKMCTLFGLTLFLWSRFFCLLESLTWNRKSDVLFTGFSA